MSNTRTRRATGAPDRSELPTLMLAEDVARVLGLKSASAARRAILRGRCGRYSRQGRRLIVRREEFLTAIRAAEVAPLAGGAPVRASPTWGRDAAKRTRPRGSSSSTRS